MADRADWLGAAYEAPSAYDGAYVASSAYDGATLALGAYEEALGTSDTMVAASSSTGGAFMAAMKLASA